MYKMKLANVNTKTVRMTVGKAVIFREQTVENSFNF